MMKAQRINDEEQWRKVRHIAYEVWRKGSKKHTTPESYMPIGAELTINDMTEEELDKVWEKYGKLRRN